MAHVANFPSWGVIHIHITFVDLAIYTGVVVEVKTLKYHQQQHFQIP